MGMRHTLADRYNAYVKDNNLTLETLPGLLVSCGYMPKDLKKLLSDIRTIDAEGQRNGEAIAPITIENDTVVTQREFLLLTEKLTPFKAADELLKHLLSFTNKQTVIKKEHFEKMLKGNEELSRQHLDNLYSLMDIKDDKINLEEFVRLIVDENQ